MGARLLDDSIDRGEVEASGLRLYVLPINWNLQRVEMQGFGGGPKGLQTIGPAAGIVHLSPKHDVRLSVDQQSVFRPLFDELRCRCGCQAEGEYETEDRYFHGPYLIRCRLARRNARRRHGGHLNRGQQGFLFFWSDGAQV